MVQPARPGSAPAPVFCQVPSPLRSWNLKPVTPQDRTTIGWGPTRSWSCECATSLWPPTAERVWICHWPKFAHGSSETSDRIRSRFSAVSANSPSSNVEPYVPGSRLLETEPENVSVLEFLGAWTAVGLGE